MVCTIIGFIVNENFHVQNDLIDINYNTLLILVKKKNTTKHNNIKCYINIYIYTAIYTNVHSQCTQLPTDYC